MTLLTINLNFVNHYKEKSEKKRIIVQDFNMRYYLVLTNK